MHFLPITFDRIEIERCGWSQCVPLAETHRLICNMTYLGHEVTSSDLDLRSNFDLDFSRSTKVNMHIFRRVSTRGTRWRPNYLSSFLSSKVISEKPFGSFDL